VTSTICESPPALARDDEHMARAACTKVDESANHALDDVVLGAGDAGEAGGDAEGV
jgi:hypothetical protein